MNQKIKVYLITKMENKINSVLHGDCIDVLSGLENNCIDLVVTSPPYNVGIEYHDYEDNLSIKDYKELINKLFRLLNRKVKNTGRICLNVSLKNDDSIIDTPSFIKNILNEIGWDLRFEIIWNKGSSESSSAWGSWRSPSSPRPIFNHEYIFIFDVSEEKKEYKKSIPKDRFMDIVKSVWDIPPETQSNHPAPFPEEIPKRLIELNSYEKDIILDPFIGSGTTAVAAEKLNRNWIGVEQSKKYVDMCYKRIENETERAFEGKSIFNY